MKWIAIAALVAFEIAVVGMILSPQVDPQYRAVYIDRTSECWPHPVSGAIEAGRTIAFTTPAEDSKSVLRCGWLPPEHTGTWSVGPESRLLLQLAPDRSATLDIELAPFTETQRVQVIGNGATLTEWVVTPADPHQTLALPATTDGIMEIAFHFPDAVMPRDLGLADDHRTLAIRLLSMTLHQQ